TFAVSGVGGSSRHNQPTPTPATIAIRIHVVSLIFTLLSPRCVRPRAEAACAGRRRLAAAEGKVCRRRDAQARRGRRGIGEDERFYGLARLPPGQPLFASHRR